VFGILIQPSSSHFLYKVFNYSLDCINESNIMLAHPLWVMLKANYCPLTFSPFGFVERFKILEHGFSCFQLLCRRSLLWLWLSRCFPQGMLHLYIGSTASVDMCVFLWTGFKSSSPFQVCLRRSLLLFLGLPFLVMSGLYRAGPSPTSLLAITFLCVIPGYLLMASFNGFMNDIFITYWQMALSSSIWMTPSSTLTKISKHKAT